MKKKSFYLYINECNFYCELRGKGEIFIIHPCGCNDCGAYEKFANNMAKDYSVLTFDPRGGSRSMPDEDRHVTPKMMADDMAAIMKELGMDKASFYGCSSGGQAVLAMALYYPELCRNVFVHEAALQLDSPLPEAGFHMFQQASTYAPYCHGFSPMDIAAVCDYDKYMELDPVCRARMEENGKYWGQYYIGSADSVTYSDEELVRMKNVIISTGVWSAAWCVAANISLARRGNFMHNWMMSAHAPHITCPEELARYVKTWMNKE